MRPACSWWVLCTSALTHPTIEITSGMLRQGFHASWHAWEPSIPRESAVRVVLSRTSLALTGSCGA